MALKNKAAIVVLTILVVPLAMYFVPYAYATSGQGNTYVVDGQLEASGDLAQGFAHCNSGDYSTGGGFNIDSSALQVEESAAAAGGGIIYGGSSPNGWYVLVFDASGSASSAIDSQTYVFAVCQSPITVAGMGVPEFGQLYLAIALGAVVYFLVARRYSLARTTSSTAN